MHLYPADLARYVLDHWEDSPHDLAEVAGRAADSLPSLEALVELLSVCYQASLLKEEDRPVKFRLILREPARFPADVGSLDGQMRIGFARARYCDEQELRRLSPATDFYRSLVGCRLDRQKRLRMWGIVHTGPGWMQSYYGGASPYNVLPLSLVICVSGPGRISVCKGSALVATLRNGRIIRPAEDIFDSRWLPKHFASVRGEIWSRHLGARQRTEAGWAALDPQFIRDIGKNVLRRIIGNIRTSQHGCSLIFLPSNIAGNLRSRNRYVTTKYPLAPGEPARIRYQTLMAELLDTMARVHGARSGEGTVGWKEYVHTADAALLQLNDALFEFSHLIADLSSVDGAVVMTDRLELLGFGGEISGRLGKVATVARAMDIEGEERQVERIERFGTRHRSVYRLCNALHEAMAIVISHDSVVRFVQWKDGMVTYWTQVTVSMLDF